MDNEITTSYSSTMMVHIEHQACTHITCHAIIEDLVCYMTYYFKNQELVWSLTCRWETSLIMMSL